LQYMPLTAPDHNQTERSNLGTYTVVKRTPQQHNLAAVQPVFGTSLAAAQLAATGLAWLAWLA
jgi:hypothetical protein